jgi:hypothetical protein
MCCDVVVPVRAVLQLTHGCVCVQGKGHTPLHLAALHGFEEVASLLIDFDADVNARNTVRCSCSCILLVPCTHGSLRVCLAR